MPQQIIQQRVKEPLFKREEVRTMQKDIIEAQEKRSRIERAMMGGFKIEDKKSGEMAKIARARMEVEEIEIKKREQGIEEAEQWIEGSAGLGVMDEVKRQKIKEIEEREKMKQISESAKEEKRAEVEAEAEKMEQ
ncbi:hypothetical protein KAW43_02605, partial [Candidatus Parcubacteria bacterium]|nr:hypothetical protein [Candidatus Parcubacteria bacterium]